MKKFIFVAFVLSIFFVGCQPAKDTFYWGDYSTTLYNMKKNPDDKTLELHKKEILNVIETSDLENKQVPPGVFAEYGYILLKNGDEKGGMEYLDKELNLYPESQVFITRIKAEYSRSKK
jgi:hypothetical protein